MEKINVTNALFNVNKLLSKQFKIEQYITEQRESFKTFSFELMVNLSEYSDGELINGSPEFSSNIVENKKQVESEIEKYLVNNKLNVLKQEFEKYQYQKTSVYVSPSTSVAEESFYCKQRCNYCAATGRVRCEACIGNGYVTCGRCHGSGKTHFHDSKTNQAKVQTCNFCNNGRAQCTTCSSSGFVVCDDCGGETFNSWLMTACFKLDIVYKPIFDNDDNKSIFAITVKNMSIQKLLTICKFEQYDSKLTDSSFIIFYKASIPVLSLDLSIHGKAQKLTLLSNNGDFCESVALLDDVLKPLLDLCKNYLTSSNDKCISKLYQSLNEIPFIKTSLNSINSTMDQADIVEIIDGNAAGQLSTSNIHILANAIKKSFDYKPKEFFPVLTSILAIPNLFFGLYLAFGFVKKPEGFYGDLFNCGLSVLIFTWILMIITNFCLCKVGLASVHKHILQKTQGCFKRIYRRCFNYALVLAIIGAATSSYQYHFAIDYFKLTDKYVVQKHDDKNHDDASAPVKQKSKKQKKAKH